MYVKWHLSNELQAAAESRSKPNVPQQLKEVLPFILFNYKLLPAIFSLIDNI